MFTHNMFSNWTADEDKLLEDVLTGEPKKAIIWSVITFRLNKLGCKKSLKEIKTRYMERSQLRRKDQHWSKENLKKIFDYYAEYGSQWTIIASKFQEQTDNTVKNRFFSLLRKALRKMVRLLRNKLNISYTKIINQIKPKVLTTLLERSVTVRKDQKEAKLRIIDIIKEFSFNQVDQLKTEEVNEKYPQVVKVIDLAMNMNEMYKENKAIIHSRYELDYDSSRTDNERNIDHLVSKQLVNLPVSSQYNIEGRREGEKGLIKEFKEEVIGVLNKTKILNNDLDYIGFSNITEIDDKLADLFNSKVGELLDLSMNLRAAFHKNKKSEYNVEEPSEEFNDNFDESSLEQMENMGDMRIYGVGNTNQGINRQNEIQPRDYQESNLIRNVSIEMNNGAGGAPSLLAKRFNMIDLNKPIQEKQNKEIVMGKMDGLLAKRESPSTVFNIFKNEKKKVLEREEKVELKRVKEESVKKTSRFDICPINRNIFNKPAALAKLHIPAIPKGISDTKIKLSQLTFPSFEPKAKVIEPISKQSYYDPVLNDKTKKYTIQFALHDDQINFINTERIYVDKRPEEATIRVMDPVEGGEFVYNLN